MPVFKLNVKWGKEKFQDVECDSEEPPMVFKAQLFALSGVQPDRQKVMIKGGVLKDDEWGKLKLKDGMTLIMMGTADALPAEPVAKVQFLEDMTEEQLATVLEMPPGLTNLGNTCYMNATLQCLRSVPELKQALKKFTGSLVMGGAMMPDQSITAGIRDLYEQMDKTANAVPPIIMLNVLHMCFPHFAEKNEQGVFQQQDANECWTEVVRCLQKKLPTVPPEGAIVAAGEGEAAASRFFIDEYFGGEFAITMKCIEAEDEAPSYSSESFLQLSCFIEKEVKYLNTGLKNRLEEHISKHSVSLSRDAQYLKSCKISKLPAYLTIQMVRFYYKEKEAVNAKILKDIKFGITLDVFDLCTDDLQQALIPAREKFKEDEDRKLEERNVEKASAPETKDKTETEKKTTKQPYWFPDKPGSNNSGYYELQAVLTHKGRSSSSGHYVGWVRRKGDDWLMFDDDRVVAVTSEDILKLSGGGDWHCAYVLLYGPRVLEVEEGREAPKTNSSEETTSSVAMETDQTS